MLADLSAFVREHLPSHAPPSSSAGPLGPSEESDRPLGKINADQSEPSRASGDDEARPSGPVIVEQQQEEEWPSGPLTENLAGPSGPILVEDVHIEEVVVAEGTGPAGPAEDASPQEESVAIREEEPTVAPEPYVFSSLPTPAPPSPPTSSTAPPAPTTFKRPRSRTISSPTPFSSQTPSSPTSSTIIPPPLSSAEVPPTSSSAGASSTGPSSLGPSDLPSITHESLFHPRTPPSFITIIPEGAQLAHTEIQGIKDEFEVAILRSVLAVGTHSHRTGPSSPVPKKRRLTSPIMSLLNPEIKFIRHYKMYCDYCYLGNIPEVQLGQFRQAIRALSSRASYTEPLQVDFATLAISDVVFFPPLHSLIMDSSVGTLIFERAAWVMARLYVQEGRNLSSHRFVFNKYLQGYLKANILAPILSECERLSPVDWEKLYPLSAQQLQELNASQARSNQPLLTPGDFLDANSLHLVRDSFMKWEERYRVFLDLKKELRQHQIFYPFKIDQFLQFASFGSFTYYKTALGNDKYGDFILDQRQLHIKRMAPTMGPSYRIELGAFQAYFEEQERQALPDPPPAPDDHEAGIADDLADLSIFFVFIIIE
ncbi:hypothetical protein Taro_046199 [Colocasia esculenta]|uniref:Uncharacterized protein n=1 Tax=Colocasia esculenta TaxID=4460 RepID=A0A843X5T5_COLES|nr:hypothetical protein [Colocasia esculenta]